MRNLALLLLGLISVPVMALTNVDLYRSEVVLDQELNNADAAARKEGMKEVIVRASGDRAAVDNEIVKKALNQHSQYITQISYRDVEQGRAIQMGFSAPHIRSLLTQAQLPFWPAQRANLLVWLVEDNQANRNIVWEHTDSPVLKQMREQAQVRGLPLTLPIGDFDDITGIAVSDIWGGFIDPVAAASQRYPVEGVLVVRASANMVRWTLYDHTPNEMASSLQTPLSARNSGDDAITRMINDISDYYAKKNAIVVAGESSEVTTVKFTNVQNALDFFQLEKKLLALSSVASLDILKLQGNEVTFSVHLLTPEENFIMEAERMGQVLKVETPPVPVQLPEPEATPVQLPEGEAVPTQLPEPVLDESSNTEMNLEPESIEVIELEPVTQAVTFEWQGHNLKPVSIQSESEPSTADESVIENQSPAVEVQEAIPAQLPEVVEATDDEFTL